MAKDCKYIIKTEGKPLSYDELVVALSNSMSTVNDILYSLDGGKSKFDIMTEKIANLQEKSKRTANFRSEFSNTSDYLTGGAEVYSNNDNPDHSGPTIFSSYSFIDSGRYITNEGKAIIPRYDMEELLVKKKNEYLEQDIDEDSAEEAITVLKNNYKKISKDATDFHKIILRMTDESPLAKVKELTKDTAFDHLSEYIRRDMDGNSVYGDIIKRVRATNSKASRELGDDSAGRIFKNVKISAKLANDEQSIIHDNIDFLAVKPDGTLEAFLVVCSHEPHSRWDRAKKEKYQHRMALLSRMLQYNGVDTRNIRFNVIPVVFNYDNTHDKVLDINVQNTECYSHRNGAFVMYEAFEYASKFIESRVSEIQIESHVLDKVNKQLTSFIPEGNVRAQGIEQTVKDYIDNNWSRWLQCKQPEVGYNLNIDGEIHYVRSSKTKSANEDAVRIVKELQLNKKQDLSAPNIIQQLKECRRSLGFAAIKGADVLNEIFSPYFEHTTERINGKEYYKYTWNIVESEDLANCNVIAFQDNYGQIDVISLSELNLDKKYIYEGQTNILNHHLSDSNAKDNQGRKLLDATYGNIDMMRVLFLLNEVLPTLKTDVKLGNITIIGGLGLGSIRSQTNPIDLVLPNFVKACQIIQEIDPNLQMSNNYIDVDKVDPTELFIHQYWSILHSNPNFTNSQIHQLKGIIAGNDSQGMEHLIDGSVRESLHSAETTAIKIERLQELVKTLQKILRDRKESTSPENLINLSKFSDSREKKECSKLLIQALITLDRLQGNIRIVDSEISELDRVIARPQDRTNSQVRIVSKLLQDAIHSTAYRLDQEISGFVQDCLEFYEAENYGKLRNLTLGDQVITFDRLFFDSDNDLIFKNPYDQNADLLPHERKFLKKALFYINKIRLGETRLRSDAEMEEFIEKKPEYLNVPLEKASSTTKAVKAWHNPLEYAKDLSRRVKEYCEDPKKYFREMYEGILTDDQQQQVTRDMEDLQAFNKFKISESERGRENMLRYGKDYFETNVQNLVIDYIHKAIQEQEMNKMLLQTKGILLYLQLKSPTELSNEEKQRQSKVIDEYLKTSVYNVSTMRPELQKVEARIMPFRKAVTKAYIMLSPVAAVRDVIGGLRSNIVRSLTKYRTDIDAKDVMWAYQYVLRHGSMSTMTIDLLDKFNTKYLISNINVEQQQEGYKSDTQGLASGNWLYATLRKPDFLNRMVLFMAKLKHDGSYKAYSVENGILKYNWTLDERFSLLASNNKSNIEEYNKQKALYLSQIIAYNKERGTNLPVSLDTNLPEGYTLNQIEEIKHLGNTIYGAYSASEKAGYEQMFLGHQFAVFSTWMNGIWDVYFGQRRESSYETEKVQAEDEYGNKLYLDEDGNITITVTDTPYLKDVPLIVQGVFNTLKDLGAILLFKNNKWETFKSEILGNKVQKRNLLRGLSDLLMFLLLKFLVMEALDEEYKEHKKTSDGQDVIKNALTEILYKGYSSSYEEFRGPFPIFDYVINNTKPAAFQWQQKFLNDTGRMLFGDKTFGEYIVGMQALPRSMQDTYKMYMRDRNKPIEE